jgi:hypothetical protein
MGLASKLTGAVLRYRRYQVFERDLTQAIPPADASASAQFRVATAEDIRTRVAADLGYSEEWKSSALESIGKGNVCVIAEQDGRIVQAGWVSFDSVTIPPRSLPLGPGWAYFHDVRTAPGHDDAALRRAGAIFRINVAKERGATRGVNLVFSGYRSTVQELEALGFRLTGDVKRARVLTWWWWDRYPVGLSERLLNAAA